MDQKTVITERQVRIRSLRNAKLKMQNSKLQFKIKNFRNGFTLIELLVVIAIVGILAGFLMANFIGVRQRGRDGVRKSDLRQIQSALELFRSDKGCYPGPGCAALNPLPACGSAMASGGITYMQEIPCDPLGTAPFVYSYTSAGGGATYSLFSCLENTNDPQKDSSNNAACTGASWSFTVANP